MLAAGSRLGPYEIKSSIAAGGMGEVYRAVDTRLDRSVAVKILPSDFNAQLRTRFEREAKLISSLTHPNICTLHDVGESNGTHYLVMELIEGETLADRLTRGAMPLPELLNVGIQIAGALQKAHRHGVVHRDLKPGNIMLTKHGVKLLDFGLAKTVGPLADISYADATQHKPLTAEGTIVGTFQYMAPEQLEGVEADARTDIFALGAVLYEMATGKRAFEGKTRTSLIAAIVQGQPAPIHQLQPLTPPALERLIETCMAKDPDDRVQSAHDVMLQLRWIAEGTLPRPVAAKSSLALLVPIAIAAVLIGAASAWFLLRKEKKVAYSFTVPGATAQYRDIATVTISPDGTKIAFSARDFKERKQFVWVQPLDSTAVRRLDASDLTQLLCWTPDSRAVIVYRGRAVIKVPVDGSAPQTIAQVNLSQADMNAAGDLIVGYGDNVLTRVNTNTGEQSQVTTLNSKEGEIAHGGARFLPDGRHFLYIARTRSSTSTTARMYRAYVGSLDNREVNYLGELNSGPVYADPGYLLYVRETVLEARPFDAKTLHFTGPPRTVMANVAQQVTLGAFSVSRDGTLVARRPRRSHAVHRIDGTGRVLGKIGEPDFVSALRVSPDGERVAVSLADAKIGTFDIWALGIHHPTRERLVVHPASDGQPVWSADGSALYFSSDRDSVPDVYAISTDGAGEARLVTGGPGAQAPLDVSPDNTVLLFSTSVNRENGRDLQVVSTNGGTPKPFVIAPREQGDARFSPDGRLVAYASFESGTVEVYVRPFATSGRARQVSAGRGTDSRPVWSRDGKWIFFVSGTTVFRVAAEGNGEPEPLFQLSDPLASMASFDIAPDGTFIAGLASEEFNADPLQVVVDWQRLLKD